MTNRDLFEFQQALGLVADLPGGKFAYAVVKNRAKVDSIINALYKVKRHSKEKEFERRRVEICEKYCDKDDDNNPVLEHDAFQGLQDNADFDTDMDKLRKEFKAVMDHREKEKKVFDARLEEEVEIDIHKVFLDIIPEAITANQLAGIMPMVIE